jgi:hypothetical protein
MWMEWSGAKVWRVLGQQSWDIRQAVRYIARRFSPPCTIISHDTILQKMAAECFSSLFVLKVSTEPLNTLSHTALLSFEHRFNMEVDLQSLFGLHVT